MKDKIFKTNTGSEDFELARVQKYVICAIHLFE